MRWYLESLSNFFLLISYLSLGGDAATRVGDLDTESLGLLDDVDTLAGRDGVADPMHLLVVVWGDREM